MTFLWRANGSPEPSEKENPFTDVSPDSYYYKAVLWAVEQGITSGVTKTAFAPDRVCTPRSGGGAAVAGRGLSRSIRDA